MSHLLRKKAFVATIYSLKMYSPKMYSLKIFLLLSVFCTSSAFATVVSLKNKGSITTDQGRVVTQIEVVCARATLEPRYIVSVPNDRRWCSQDVPNVCGRTKVSVAKKVCKPDFSSQITGYNDSLLNASETQVPEVIDAPAVAVDVVPQPEAVAVDSKILIEEEKLRIEQEKLELRRKELELNKRRLELERESAAN